MPQERWKTAFANVFADGDPHHKRKDPPEFIDRKAGHLRKGLTVDRFGDVSLDIVDHAVD